MCKLKQRVLVVYCYRDNLLAWNPLKDSKVTDMTSQLSRPIMAIHPGSIIESFVVESQVEDVTDFVTLKESALEDLAEMISDRELEILSDLVNTFLGEANRQVQNMVRAMASDNLSLLFLPAHSLKSSSATFGAMRLSQLSEQLETLITNAPDRTVIGELVEQIRNENAMVVIAMQNALAQWQP